MNQFIYKMFPRLFIQSTLFCGKMRRFDDERNVYDSQLPEVP